MRKRVIKQLLVDQAGLGKLGRLSHGPKGALRTGALAVMKNAAFAADIKLKERIAAAIGWIKLTELLETSMDKIGQVEVLGLMRNLACSCEHDIAWAVVGISESLLWPALIAVLLGDRPAASRVNAMAIMVNVRLEVLADADASGMLGARSVSEEHCQSRRDYSFAQRANRPR